MHRFVLFIHKQSGPDGDRLQEMIRLHFPNIPREQCAGLGRLRERLKHPESNEKPVIYVLFADTKDRLNQLLGLYEYLEGRRLILILPDNHQTTRSGGLRLLPRFITYANDSFDDLIAVIEKMIGASSEKQPGRETTDASKYETI
jgi:hypothetical protein